MRLKRYVLCEHLAPFFFSFAVIIFLLTVDLVLQMLDLILGKGVDWVVVLELFFLNTAWMAALAVPMSVLGGTLMAFGRMSGDNELIAAQALGVGLHQLIWPVLVCAGLLGAALVLFNDRVLPEFNHRARLLATDIRRKQPSVALESGIFIKDFDSYKILIGEIDQKSSALEQVIIYRYKSTGYPVTIFADRGRLSYDDRSDEVSLVLRKGEIHRVDASDPGIYVRARFEKQVLRLGKAGRRLSRTVSSYRNDREMSISMLSERAAAYGQEFRQLEADRKAYLVDFLKASLLGDVPGERAPLGLRGWLAQAKVDAALARHRQRAADRNWVEVHKKFSIPAACLVFVLVGAPLGLQVKVRGAGVGAGISIVFFLFYWAFLIGGERLADRGYLSPWLSMWAANLVVGATGVWMSQGLVTGKPLRALGRRVCLS